LVIIVVFGAIGVYSVVPSVVCTWVNKWVRVVAVYLFGVTIAVSAKPVLVIVELG
jgi:hypothetical protein